jgi:Ca2+-binding RTX toxin-like protein
MTIETVLARVEVIGFGDEAAAVISNFRAAYRSTGLAVAIDNWLSTHPTDNIQIIRWNENNANGGPAGGGRVRINFEFPPNLIYIYINGNAVRCNFLTVLVHEFGHAIGGWFDDPTISDTMGTNVDNVNNWFRQLAIPIPENVSYIAQDELGSGTDILTPGQSYTDGERIYGAITGQYQTDVDVRAANGSGSYLLFGSDGVNEYGGTDSRDHIYGNGEDDILRGYGGNDRIFGGTGNDRIYGGDDDDHIFGGDDDDNIWGDDGDDTINGGSGFNRIEGGAGRDNILGGDDVDFVEGGTENDTINGEGGNDRISGGEGNDLIAGGDDDDLIDGNNDNDILLGGDGNDTIDGGDNNDNIWGRGGADSLLGGDGADGIEGNDGNDFIGGGSGNDRLDGGDGDDTLIIDADDTVIAGGFGNDTADLRNFTSGVQWSDIEGNTDVNGAGLGGSDVELSALIGAQVSGIEKIAGTNFDDIFTLKINSLAVDGNLDIDGGGGNDQIIGNDSNNTLRGGANNDNLNGGADLDGSHEMLAA